VPIPELAVALVVLKAGLAVFEPGPVVLAPGLGVLGETLQAATASTASAPRV
jgi:hypothetical protein